MSSILFIAVAAFSQRFGLKSLPEISSGPSNEISTIFFLHFSASIGRTHRPHRVLLFAIVCTRPCRALFAPSALSSLRPPVHAAATPAAAGCGRGSAASGRRRNARSRSNAAAVHNARDMRSVVGCVCCAVHSPLPPRFVVALTECCCRCDCRSPPSADDIDKRIYTRYLNDGYCVRLTHQTGAIGCAGERRRE